MTEPNCEVWVAEIASRRPIHDDLLDGVERVRAEAFLRPDDRSRFVVGVALLKLAVAQITERPAGSVRVDRRCPRCGRPHGRPKLQEADLQVSVSHSGPRVVVALTDSGPVGIDIEQRAAERALPSAERVLAESEPLGGPEDLLTYWCRKESVVKATGDGLQVPFREVVVSAAREPARLMSYRGNPLTAFMSDLDVGPEYASALTVLFLGLVTVHIHAADRLLED
jgi:4'-phosphopantetheinyl transferase